MRRIDERMGGKRMKETEKDERRMREKGKIKLQRSTAEYLMDAVQLHQHLLR
jgi:hypothetical protein